MANLLIGYQNRADAATLAGGAWSSTLPLNNLKDRQQAKVARTEAAAITFTASASTDECTLASAHGLLTGHAVTVSNSGGGLPAGLVAGTVYYARVISPTVVQLHTSAAGAVANTGKVDITTAGTGTHSMRNSAGHASARFRADLGASYNFRVAGLVNHNLSTSARWRVRCSAASMDIDMQHPVLDPRITFTRATVATRTNSAGLVDYVASGVPRFDYAPVSLAIIGLLVEESRAQLLTHSNLFGESVWTKTSVVVMPNDAVGPDGLMSASRMQATTTGVLSQSYTKAASAITYTGSLWVKNGSVTNSFSLTIDDGTATNRGRVVIDSSGNITSTNNDGTFTATASQKITYNNGWSRYIITTTTNTTTTARLRFFYTGDALVHLWVFGAMLEEGAFATSYMPSADSFTSRASIGSFVGSNGLIQSAAIDVARTHFNPAALSVPGRLLVEPAATNLLLRSAEFDNASWAKTAVTVTANAVVSPDGGTNAELAEHTSGVTSLTQTTAAFSAGSTVTVSVWAKRWGGSQHLRINLGSLVSCWFNLTTGATGTNGAGSGNVLFSAKSMQSYGNGWYRCILTVTTTTITTLAVDLAACASDNTAPASGDVLALWGAQAEATAVATSYIATAAATATRSADVFSSVGATRNADACTMTGSSFSDWFTQGQGTFYAEFQRPVVVSASSRVLVASDGTGTNDLFIGTSSVPNHIAFLEAADITQASFTILSGAGAVDTVYREAVSFQEHDIAGSANGGAVVTDTVAAIPTFSQLDIGRMVGGTLYINGHIRRIAYWPTALSDANLVSLTASGPSAIDYDSGWVNAMQMSLTNAVTDWGANYGLIAVASAQISARYLQVDIDDPGNSAGYIEAGRLFVGGAFQPTINAAYGLKDGWSDDLSSKTRAQAGAVFVTERRRLRFVNFQIDYLTQAEANEVHELQMLAGTTREVLYVPDSADAVHTQRYGFVGELEELSAIEFPLPSARSSGFRIKELA